MMEHRKTGIKQSITMLLNGERINSVTSKERVRQESG